jgi:hypothetical protein
MNSNPLDLGNIAKLFAKWPGPSLMGAGVVLACAAAGIRVEGVAFSGRVFAGFEFAAVFLGGILLVAIGTAVLLVRDRLLVEDEQRIRQQKHEHALEKARGAFVAGYLRAAQVENASRAGAAAFDEAYKAAKE